jgi:hypothetical protein
MAKQDFLDNFRIARNLFFHPRVAADSTQADPQAIEQRVARVAIWLTPKGKVVIQDSFSGKQAARLRFLRNSCGCRHMRWSLPWPGPRARWELTPPPAQR